MFPFDDVIMKFQNVNATAELHFRPDTSNLLINHAQYVVSIIQDGVLFWSIIAAVAPFTNMV